MILRTTALLALLATAVTHAQTPATAPAADAMVENPAYVAWSRAGVGTVIEQTLKGSRDGRSYSVVIKTTVVGVTPEGAKVEQVLTMEGGAPPKTQSVDVAPKIAASVLNVTDTPGMTRKEVGREDLTVDGKVYACVIREVSGTAPTGMKVTLRSWESLDFPGNVVRTHAKIGETAETKLEGTKVTRAK